MHLRSRTRLAWLLFLATMGCLAGGLVVSLLVTRPLTAKVLEDGAGEAVPWLLFATIGLVLTLRRPGSPIGWLYAAARWSGPSTSPGTRGSTSCRAAGARCRWWRGWPP